MSESSDTHLLDRYRRKGDQDAFRQLVERYGAMVNGVAVRQTYSVEAARDVTQEVFVALAKKAGRIGADVVLSGWLYKVAFTKSIDHLRSESRRRRRENNYAMDPTRITPSTDTDWEDLSPVLDEAISELGTRDRDAILLRYFNDKPNRAVAVAMGVTEEAAKKRVSRAVLKLRGGLMKKGIALGAGGLGPLVSQAAVPLPASAVAEITKVSLSAGGAAATAGSSIPLITFMTVKTKIVLAAMAVALGAAGVISVTAPDQSESSFEEGARAGGGSANTVARGDVISAIGSSSKVAATEEVLNPLDSAEFRAATERADQMIAFTLLMGDTLAKMPAPEALGPAHGLDNDVAKIVGAEIERHRAAENESVTAELDLMRGSREQVRDFMALSELRDQGQLSEAQTRYLEQLEAKGFGEFGFASSGDSEILNAAWYQSPETVDRIRKSLPPNSESQFDDYLENLKTVDRESDAFHQSQDLARKLNLDDTQRQAVFERIYGEENDLSDILNEEQNDAYKKLREAGVPASE